MKSLIRLCFLFFISVLFIQTSFAQDMVSTFKPKSQTEKLVIAKLRSLSEIKEIYAQTSDKNYKPDIAIRSPDSEDRNYLFQVGFEQPDRFATSYYLSINPKTLQVYYEDFDDEGIQDITLQQWRYWRKRPEFNKPHKWVNGKLMLTEIKPHVRKKSPAK